MKKYNIKVNGISYEVEVEEVVAGFASSPQTPAKQTPSKNESASKAEVNKTGIAGEKIECPMPGTVLKVNVKPDDNVKEGQVMFILEAMKMENEIISPYDAKVLEVIVASGASVNAGDILAVIQK